MIHKAVVSHTLSSWDTSQEPTQESFSFHSRCSSATWPIPYSGSGSGFLTSIFIGHLPIPAGPDCPYFNFSSSSCNHLA
jgi:hypothetical protein